MLDWLNGYFTAFRHFSAMKESEPALEISVMADIATACATILAALIAAYAAHQSNKAARHSAQIALEAERGRVVQEAVSLTHEIEAKKESVGIVIRAAKNHLFPSDETREIRQLQDELVGDWDAFQAIMIAAARIVQNALQAKDASALSEVSRDLIFKRATMVSIQSMTENRQRNAWKIGLIKKPPFVRD